MKAGVLSYWLCPRTSTCEDCPLDRFLSGRERLRTGLASSEGARDALHRSAAPRLQHLRVPLRRRLGVHHHCSHIWAQQVANGRVRIGLDDIAARLTRGSTGWSLPTRDTSLAVGDCCGRTQVNGVTLRVASPLPGRVVLSNLELCRHPTLAVWSPCDAGWLLEISTPVQLDLASGFMHDDAVLADWFDAEIGRLARLCPPTDDEIGAGIGETLADGGLPLCSLREALGEEGLRKALRRFFPWCEAGDSRT